MRIVYVSGIILINFILNNNVNSASITLNLANSNKEENINNKVMNNIEENNNELINNIEDVSDNEDAKDIEDKNYIENTINIEKNNNCNINYLNNNDKIFNTITNSSNNKLINNKATKHEYKHIVTYSDGHGNSKKLCIDDFNNNKIIYNHPNINNNIISNYSDYSKNIIPSNKTISDKNNPESDKIVVNNKGLFKNKITSSESLNKNNLKFSKITIKSKLKLKPLAYNKYSLNSGNINFNRNKFDFSKLDLNSKFSKTNIIKNNPNICKETLKISNNNFAIGTIKSYPIVDGNCILNDNTVLNLQYHLGLQMNASSMGILLDKVFISSEIKKLSIINKNNLNPVVFINYNSNFLNGVTINCQRIPYLNLNNLDENSNTCEIKGIIANRYTILNSNKILVINGNAYSEKPLVIMNNKIIPYKDVYLQLI